MYTLTSKDASIVLVALTNLLDAMRPGSSSSTHVTELVGLKNRIREAYAPPSNEIRDALLVLIHETEHLISAMAFAATTKSTSPLEIAMKNIRTALDAARKSVNR